VSALCFGINTYSSLQPLKNCEADAKAFAEQVQSLPDGNSHCVATVRTGAQLKSKADMEKAVRDFVTSIDKEAPPRMVAITFSGHGIQVGEGILMLPSGVSSEPHEMQKEGFSHNEIFTILYKEVHKKTQARDVYYLLIIDACRETPQESAVGFSGTLDPVYRDAVGEEAMRWALCAGTSRGSTAADAGTLDASHLGAFTSCVISEECGLFQPNVPVTTAIKLASERVRNNQSRCQAPLTLLDNISCDFCLNDDESAEQERFDVCVCCRVDTDGSGAKFIADSLESKGVKVFWKSIAGKQTARRQMAQAVCNSKVIILIVSEQTFAGISTLTSSDQATDKHTHLAELLRQMEMILEVYEHRRRSILPVYYGDEQLNPVTFVEMIKELDRSRCWPTVSRDKALPWVPLVRQRALRDLRCVDKNLSRLLHDRYLSRVDGADVPSLIKGRQVGQTLLAFQSFAAMEPLIGKTHDAGLLVANKVDQILRGLRDSSKRALESDGPEASANAAASSAAAEPRSGGSAAAREGIVVAMACKKVVEPAAGGVGGVKASLNAATKSGSGPLVSADDVSMASTNLQGSQSSLPSSGHACPPARDEHVPKIEGYVVDKKIGAGGQGTVWLARGQVTWTQRWQSRFARIPMSGR
jgi:hypothetical protein